MSTLAVPASGQRPSVKQPSCIQQHDFLTSMDLFYASRTSSYPKLCEDILNGRKGDTYQFSNCSIKPFSTSWLFIGVTNHSDMGAITENTSTGLSRLLSSTAITVQQSLQHYSFDHSENHRAG
ncbi:unnamed protein product [Umbelopsis ramanniana]